MIRAFFRKLFQPTVEDLERKFMRLQKEIDEMENNQKWEQQHASDYTLYDHMRYDRFIAQLRKEQTAVTDKIAKLKKTPDVHAHA